MNLSKKDKTLFFIADVHLNPKDNLTQQKFTGFIKYAQNNAEELYILGDLFDIWLGDDISGEYFALITESLKQASQQIPIFFIAGNRDFLLGTVFAEQCGMQLLPEVYQLQYQNQLWLLLHGDTLCTDDADYQKMRKVLRNLGWQQEFLRLSISERIEKAQHIQAESKKVKITKSMAIMDVNSAAVEKLLTQYPDSQGLIHGHTHRPAVHPLANNKTRLVVSDWDNKIQYGRLNSKGLELRYFNA